MIIIGIMLVSSGILHHSMQSLTESILLDVLQPMAGESAKTVEQAIKSDSTIVFVESESNAQAEK